MSEFAGNFHAVSCSVGKDNVKNLEMDSFAWAFR